MPISKTQRPAAYAARRTTMRYQELMRLVNRLREEQSRLERHADSLMQNDKRRWRGPLDAMEQAIEAICSSVSHERPHAD